PPASRRIVARLDDRPDPALEVREPLLERPVRLHRDLELAIRQHPDAARMRRLERDDHGFARYPEPVEDLEDALDLLQRHRLDRHPPPGRGGGPPPRAAPGTAGPQAGPPRAATRGGGLIKNRAPRAWARR